MSSSHVVVIATDLRRATVKVNPGTYLTEVLEQACKKLNLDESKHLFKYKQKTVDLSVPFRTSGLVTGAKLELVLKAKTPSAVQIALQVPQPEARHIPGGRLIKRFPADLPIWQVLRQFESGEASAGKNINITARGVAEVANGASSGVGQLYYETPVLNIMGREIATFAQFQKTMSQLGHNSGNVLIRLSFRKTEQTLYDAMAEMGRFFKEEEEEEEQQQQQQQQQQHAQKGGQDQQDVPAQDEPAEDGDAQDTTMAAMPEAGPSSVQETASAPTDGETRSQYEPVGVFLAPSGPTPAAALAPVEENDYIPTVAHAQLHQQRLQESSRNRRLLSDRELQEKEDLQQARIAAVTSVRVKVRFPDNTSSDWQIGPSDTGAFLYAAVRHVMASPGQGFHLVSSGSKTVVRDDDSQRHSLVKAYKFSGRVLLSLVWEDGVPLEVRRAPFLKSSVASQGQEVTVQDIPTVDGGVEEEADRPAAESRPARREDGDGSVRKVPKWLKLGKK